MNEKFISEITEKELKKKIDNHNKLVNEANLTSMLFSIPAFMGLEVISHYSSSNGIINLGLPDNFDRHLNSLIGAAAISIWLNGGLTFYISYETKLHRHFYRALKKYDKKSEESLLKSLKEIKNPFYSLLMETSLYLHRKDYDRAMLCLSRYSHISKKYGNSQTLFEKVMFTMIPKIIDFQSYFKKGLDEGLGMAVTNFALGKEEKAMKKLDNIIAENPEYSTELSLLAGIWRNNAGKKDEARPYLKKSLDEILKKGKESFSKVADSKNEVLEYNLEYNNARFFNDAVIFKRSLDEKRLIRGGKIIDLHRKAYQKNVFEALLNPLVIPLEESFGILGENPITWALKRIKAETLESLLDKNNPNLMNEYKLSITNLIKLMAFSTPYYGKIGLKDIPYDYGSEFERRVVKRLGPGKFPKKYQKEISEINKIADKLCIKVLAHRDASDSNVLVGGYIIDFESAGTADPILDIATLTTCLKNNDAFRLFDYAYKELYNNFKMEKELSFELFKKARIHAALGQMSSMLERGSEKNIEKAKNLYSMIKESEGQDFVEYVTGTRYALSA